MKTIGLGALYALSHVTQLATAKTLPSVDDFYRIAHGGIAALGDYVYVEGGELADKSQQKKSALSRRLDVTLSIDVTKDWETKDVKYNEIDRGEKPITGANTLWADEKKNKLYQWDGGGPWGNKGAADGRELWEFDPDGKGGGEWSVAKVSNPDALSNTTRMAMAAATVCGGKGFIIGGWENSDTDARSDADPSIPVPGMVSFDFETKEWKNISEPMMPGTKDDNGAFVRGEAVCVKGFGDTEYILPIGGVSSGLDSFARSDENWKLMSMETLSLFDVKKEKWIQQKTTGDPKVPDARTDHCAAGAQSVNGTYEVFLYGGRTPDKKVFSDVWILTIPGFHWVQANVRADRRHYHKCALAGNRGREILVLGGYNEKTWSSKDEYPYGMGVWDMSQMNFAYEYDGSSGGEYEPPEKVQKWYREGGLKEVDWDSNEVEKIFSNQSEEKDDDKESPTQGNDGDEDKDDEKKSTTQGKDGDEKQDDGKEDQDKEGKEKEADKDSSDEENGKELDKEDDITNPDNTRDPPKSDSNSDGSEKEEEEKNSDSDSDRSSLPIGAIIGGVIGGVALLVTIAFLIWFIRRRSPSPSTSLPSSIADEYPHYTTTASPHLAEAQVEGSEYGQYVHHHEKDGYNLREPRAELGDETRAELEGDGHPRIGSHAKVGKGGWRY